MRARRFVPGTVAVAAAAAVGVLGLMALPAAAASGQAGTPAGGRQWLRSNTAYTHSPQVLRQLAGVHAAVINGPQAAITNGPVAGAPQGIDVSSQQESQTGGINWATIAGDGIKFVAIKATEGDYYKNTYAPKDLQNAGAAGLKTIAYAFAIPNGGSIGTTTYSSDPAVQADDLISYLTSNSIPMPPVMLDIENDPYAGPAPNGDGTSGSCYGLTQSAMVSWISGFDAEITAKTGHSPFIYTNPSWWHTCTGDSTAFGQVPLWAASWTTASSPTLPAGWTTWDLWQYTSAGSVTGITGNVDLDQANPNLITVTSPGSLSTVAGSPVRLAVKATDSVPGYVPSFTAVRLPPGLSISPAGLITGWSDTPGSHSVTVTAADRIGAAKSVSFSWTITPAPDSGPAGPVRLAMGGKCLNDTGNSTSNGTVQDIWTCNGSVSQKWTVVKDRTLRIHGKCLDVYHGGTASGTRVDLYSCNGTRAQQWRVQTGGEVVNPASGKCLTDPNGSTTNGTRLRIVTCAALKYQKWILPAGPVVSQLPGKCLNDNGNLTANGTRMNLWTCNGTTAQAFTVRPDGTVRIHGKCLDVYHGGTTAGTVVDLYTCNGTRAQQWQITPAKAGVMLVSPASGLALSLSGTSSANGTAAVLAAAAGAVRELWRVQ